MEALNQAKNRYIKLHHYQACHSDEERRQLHSDTERFINIAIKELLPPKLFNTPDFLEILRSALDSHATSEDADIQPVKRAFFSLELYFLQLAEHPWKPEFKKIKVYGGFYKTKIKCVLPGCETIFLRAGYSISPDGRILIHKGPIKEMPLLTLAFDCKIAQSECTAIIEHYKKVKGMSVSLSTAVDGFLGQCVQSRPMSNGFKSHLSGKNQAVSVNSNANVNDVKVLGPPSLPRRDPIQKETNGDVLQPRGVRNQHDSVPFGSIPRHEILQSHDLLQPTPVSHVSSVAVPQVSPGPIFPPPSSQNVKTIFTPEAAIQQLNSIEDFIPEVPRGYLSDHMEESLKIMSGQQLCNKYVPQGHEASFKKNPPRSGDWSNQLMNYRNDNGVPGNNRQDAMPYRAPDVMYARSVATFPPGIVQPRTVMLPPSSLEDEGIDKDFSHSSKGTLPSGKMYQQFGQQTVLPNKPSSVYMSDYGSYNSNGSRNSQPFGCIYQPPNIQTDSSIKPKGLPSATNMGISGKGMSVPPPIPPRYLKPVNIEPIRHLSEQEEADGFIHVIPASLQVNLPPQNANSYYTVDGRPPVSPKSLSEVPKQSSGIPNIRRDRMLAGSGKSSSLKYPDTKVSMLQQDAHTRGARSMDMSLHSWWYCKVCTAQNEGSQSVCNTCSHSRLGPDMSHPILGQSKKTCPRCTLENDADRKVCDACQEKLADTFTFV